MRRETGKKKENYTHTHTLTLTHPTTITPTFNRRHPPSKPCSPRSSLLLPPLSSSPPCHLHLLIQQVCSSCVPGLIFRRVISLSDSALLRSHEVWWRGLWGVGGVVERTGRGSREARGAPSEMRSLIIHPPGRHTGRQAGRQA